MNGLGLERHGRATSTWAILLFGVAALFACGEARDETSRQRVFLIGIDGASPRVAQTLIDQGKLPTLSAIARAGASGRILSARPILSPRIWTSVATGKVPEKHGIEEFRIKQPGEKKRLYTSADRRAHALWNIASGRGASVGVVNWWITHPAEGVRGVMMSDHLIPAYLPGAPTPDSVEANVSAAAVFPPSWAARLIEAVSAPEIPVPYDDFLIDDDALPHWVDRGELSVHLRTDAAAARSALAIEAELRPDLLMVFMPGIDRVSHWLWGSIEPAESYPEKLRPTPAERAAGARALYRYYEYVDALIGRLIAGAGPEDLVIVLSDHGFVSGTFRSRPGLTGRHNTGDALHGVFYARGPGIAAGSSSEGVSVNDVTPTVLAWLGWPLGRDMDGHVAPFMEIAPERVAEFVDSYDTQPIERLDGGEDADAVVLEQLRALGYFE
jgi:predicted AlkP superfamily phosphohydrolase/phosphomutase